MKRVVLALLPVAALAAACGGDDDPGGDQIDVVVETGGAAQGGAGAKAGSSTAGTGAKAGQGGTAGQGGAAGSTAGSSTAGKAGSTTAGSGGSSAGKAGASGSGTAGTGTSGSGTAGTGTSGSGTAGSGTAGSPPGGCPAVTYPTGISIQLKPDAALTAEYQKLGVSCPTPKCFLDTTDLKSPSGQKHDVHVKLTDHFELYEIVRTEVDPNGTGGVDAANAWSTSVLVDVDFMVKLEALRVAYGGPVLITSGFRSPPHQHSICQSICGKDQCTQNGVVTCAYNSRHMWGAAADMDLKYEAAANTAGFPFVFHENGGTAPHLHVDMKSCN